MPFAEDMIPPLRSLAHKLIDFELYGYLSEVAQLLAAFQSGNWPKLSYDDQEIYLEKMQGTFHVRGMGDTEAAGEPEYGLICDRVYHELRSVRRKTAK